MCCVHVTSVCWGSLFRPAAGEGRVLEELATVGGGWNGNESNSSERVKLIIPSSMEVKQTTPRGTDILNLSRSGERREEYILECGEWRGERKSNTEIQMMMMMWGHTLFKTRSVQGEENREYKMHWSEIKTQRVEQGIQHGRVTVEKYRGARVEWIEYEALGVTGWGI